MSGNAASEPTIADYLDGSETILRTTKCVPQFAPTRMNTTDLQLHGLLETPPTARAVPTPKTDFYHLLELAPSIHRLQKGEGEQFEAIAARTLQVPGHVFGLKPGDKEIHHHLLSLPDDWDFEHLARFLAKHYGRSKRTYQRVIHRLCLAGLLARVWNQKTRKTGYQVFEAPVIGRPTGADANKCHVVMARKAGSPGYQSSPSMPKKHRGFLTTADIDPAFSRPARGVTRVSPIHITKAFVPPTSEQKKNPKSLCEGLAFSNDLRVVSDDSPDYPVARSAGGAKRRKGRRSPGKSHNARRKAKVVPRPGKPAEDGQTAEDGPRSGRYTRPAFAMEKFKATADARSFVRNLPTELPAALEAIRSLPATGTWAWVDALRVNPLTAVAQVVYGYTGAWELKDLRRFANTIGGRLPVNDLLVAYYGMTESGVLTERQQAELRSRLEYSTPAAPTILRSEINREQLQLKFTWDKILDKCRDDGHEKATRVVSDLIAAAGYFPFMGQGDIDLSTLEARLFWTCARNCEFLGIAPEVLAHVEDLLVPVTAEEARQWIAAVPCSLPGGWHPSWCVFEGGLITELSGGVQYLAGLDDEPMAVYSTSHAHLHYNFIDARSATVTHFENHNDPGFL